MEFPSYVPNAVRVSMAGWLEGDSRHLTGWISMLARAEAKLLRIQREREICRHDEAMSNKLRVEHAEATAHRDDLAAEVNCCQRLVHDARMQPAYALLVSLPKVTDADLSGFIHAAWAARMNYAKYREQLKAANELAREVTKAAGALAGLLRKAEGFAGPYLPSEFFSIRSLLEKTEHDFSDRNFYMWPGMRREILGELPHDSGALTAPEPEPSKPTEPPEIGIRVVNAGEAEPMAPAEAARHALRYAWGTAPSMAQIIFTMHREALNYTAVESGHIASALASRQHSGKTAYLRAFRALLRDEHQMELTTATMNAIATTATVVLNEPDDSVSYDDVRKALGTLAS